MRLFYILLCMASSLLADEKLISAESIESIYNSKSYEEACLLSENFFKQNPNNFDVNIYYGRCAMQYGDVDKAMAAFDRAEILDEENPLVHKYFGDLYVSMGNVLLANEAYDRADRLGEAPVAREITSSDDAHTFLLFMRLGAGYDTNVKYSAELSEMDDWGYSSQPEEDAYSKEYIMLNHIYDDDASSAFYYKSQLHAYNKNYRVFHEEDFAQGNVYTGAAWRTKTFDIWIPLGYTYMASNYEGYARVYSISPQLVKTFDNKVSLKIETNFEYQKYLQLSKGDKRSYAAKASVSRWFGSNYFRGSYRYLKTEKVSKDVPYLFLDKSFHESALDYTRKITKFLEAGMGLVYRKSDYDDPAKTTLSDEREDDLLKYSAYISYNLSKETGISVVYENYDNSTNYIPLDYSKEVVSVSLFVHF